MFQTLRQDIRAIKERDPAARNSVEVFLLYSGLHAVLYYRLAHWLYRHRAFFLARWVSQTARFLTGIEIHPGAKIGRGLLIDHGSGVVIGETAEVGDNCTIYQGVTLGGTGKHVGKRHPTIGDNVMIGSGAKVLGPFTVGNNAKIAAGAVVLSAVPEGATAVGVPARIILPGDKRRAEEQEKEMEKEKKKRSDLDQIHIPDPVAQELCRLRGELARLEKKVSVLAAASQSLTAAETETQEKTQVK